MVRSKEPKIIVLRGGLTAEAEPAVAQDGSEMPGVMIRGTTANGQPITLKLSSHELSILSKLAGD